MNFNFFHLESLALLLAALLLGYLIGRWLVSLFCRSKKIVTIEDTTSTTNPYNLSNTSSTIKANAAADAEKTRLSTVSNARVVTNDQRTPSPASRGITTDAVKLNTDLKPELNIDAPKVAVNTFTSELELPKTEVRQPKLSTDALSKVALATGGAAVVGIGSKLLADKETPATNINLDIKAPKIEAPAVPELALDMPEVGVNVPDLSLNKPKVEVELPNLTGHKIDLEVNTPDMGGSDIQLPDVNFEAPSLKVDVAPADITTPAIPNVTRGAVGISAPSMDTPDWLVQSPVVEETVAITEAAIPAWAHTPAKETPDGVPYWAHFKAKDTPDGIPYWAHFTAKDTPDGIPYWAHFTAKETPDGIPYWAHFKAKELSTELDASPLTHKVIEAKDTLVEKTTDLADATGAKLADATHTLADAGHTLADKAKHLVDVAKDKLVDAKEAVVDSTDATVGKVEDASGSLKAGLASAGAVTIGLGSALVHKVVDAKDAVVEKTADLADATGDKLAEAKDATVKLAVDTKHTVADAGHTLADKAKHLADSAEGKLIGAKDAVIDTTDAVIDTTGMTVDKVEDSSGSLLGSLKTGLASAGAATLGLGSTLAHKVVEAKDAVVDKTADLADATGDKLADAKHTLEDKAKHLADATSDKLADAKNAAAKLAEETKHTFADAGHTLADKAKHLADSAKDKLVDAKDAVADSTDAAVAKVEDSSGSIKAGLASAGAATLGLGSTLAHKVVEAKDAVVEKTADLADATGDKLADAKHTLADAGHTIVDKAKHLADSAEGKLVGAKDVVIDTTDAVIDTTGMTVDKVEDSSGSLLGSLKTGLASAGAATLGLGSTLAHKVVEAKDAVVEKTADLADATGDKLADAKHTLTDAGHTIVDKAKHLAETTGDKLVEAKDATVELTADTQHTLTDAGHTLADKAKHLADASGDKLANVGHTIADKAKHLAETAGDKLAAAKEAVVDSTDAAVAKVEDSSGSLKAGLTSAGAVTLGLGSTLAHKVVEAKDTVAEKAADLANKTGDKLVDAKEAAVDAGKIVADKAKNLAHEVDRKVADANDTPIEIEVAKAKDTTDELVMLTTTAIVDKAGNVVEVVDEKVTALHSSSTPSVDTKTATTEISGQDKKIFSPDLPSFHINPNHVQPTKAPVTPNEMPTVSVHLSSNPNKTTETPNDLVAKGEELLGKAKTALHDFADKNPDLVKKAEHLSEQGFKQGMSFLDKARGLAQKAVHKIEEGMQRLDDKDSNGKK
ncbi:hypothetical protein [Thiofilum flexile]|uniref:hypothetical protein n=1 Tax=Thiofilum flexile TaxID=125627 RepID=UPI00035DE923|nr:hypothetical protein [Thiofilum flexile]